MRPTLLIVEDDAATRTLLSVLLTRAGFDVDAVADGSEALLLLSGVQYSAITLDLYMHGASGHDVLAALASRPEVLARLIVVTAAPPAEVEQLRRTFRGIRAVRKPFDIDDLVAKTKAAAGDFIPPRDLAADFCRRSILVGAHAGIVLTARPAREEFDVTASYGYESGALRRFLPISVNAQYPICKSYRLGQKIWISSVKRATAEYPLLSTIWETTNAQALVTLPLVAHERSIGAVGWSFREPRAFEHREREELASIARSVGDAIGPPAAEKQAG